MLARMPPCSLTKKPAMSNKDKYHLAENHPVSSNKDSSNLSKSRRGLSGVFVLTRDQTVLETPPPTSDKAASRSESQQQAKTSSNASKGLKGSIHYPGVSDESRGRIQEPPEIA